MESTDNCVFEYIKYSLQHEKCVWFCNKCDRTKKTKSKLLKSNYLNKCNHTINWRVIGYNDYDWHVIESDTYPDEVLYTGTRSYIVIDNICVSVITYKVLDHKFATKYINYINCNYNYQDDIILKEQYYQKINTHIQSLEQRIIQLSNTKYTIYSHNKLVNNHRKELQNITDFCENELQEIKELHDIELHRIKNYNERKLQNIYKEITNDVDSNYNCLICFVNKRDIIIYPCNHICSCEKCSSLLHKCPICRIKITAKIKVFIC
jgi:hypothetical protein